MLPRQHYAACIAVVVVVVHRLNEGWQYGPPQAAKVRVSCSEVKDYKSFRWLLAGHLAKAVLSSRCGGLSGRWQVTSTAMLWSATNVWAHGFGLWAVSVEEHLQGVEGNTNQSKPWWCCSLVDRPTQRTHCSQKTDLMPTYAFCQLKADLSTPSPGARGEGGAAESGCSGANTRSRALPGAHCRASKL